MSEDQAVRNVALIGPNGSGKTTLLESLLFCAGAIGRKGRIEDGTTTGDASAEARAHHMSVEPNFASVDHEGVRFNLIDLPGSVEFRQDLRGVLPGVDLAILVVEPIAERMVTLAPLLRILDQNAVPHVVFINKMDRSNARYRDLLQALREASSRPIVPHHYAIGRGEDLVGYVDLVTEKAYHYQSEAPSDEMELPDDYREREQAARTEMLETLADFDDDLMEKLLEDEIPKADEILRNLQKTLRADEVVPVFMGVADRSMGVRRLLRSLLREAPEPNAAAARAGVAAGDGPLVQILKIFHLPHAGKISVARVWRGAVEDGMHLGPDRVSGVHRLQGGKLEAVHKAGAGDIVALGKLEHAKSGRSLDRDGLVESMNAPEIGQPMFALAVTAANRNDEVKLSAAFQKLAEEDPSLELESDAEMRQTLLWGQGEVHLKVAIERLASKFNVSIETAPPQTPYRETIKRETHAHGRHKKQSGGHGQFADVKIDIAPLDRGAGFAFESKIVGGAVPKQFIPAVEHGARDFMAQGPLGFPMVDVGVTLVDGQFHSVDSNELSFKMATALALKEGLPQCGPVLLEPVWRIVVATPSEHTSKILQLITTKRGQILGYEAKAGWPSWDEITADAPRAEMGDMIVHLRSQTQGVAFFAWRYDHLQETPTKIARDVVEQRRQAAA